MVCHLSSAKLLLIGPSGRILCDIGIEIQQFLYKKMNVKILFAKWQLFCLSLYALTHNYLETHECVISTVATDALVLKHQAISTQVLKHQAISTHNADPVRIILDQLHTKILTLQQTTSESIITTWGKWLEIKG